jgi:hypothetical protein
MRKAKIEVEEKLVYRRTIYVNVPDDMSDSEIERILTRAEKEEFLSDFMYVLDANGIVAPDGFDDDLSSPWDSEVECLEYEFVNSEKESA